MADNSEEIEETQELINLKKELLELEDKLKERESSTLIYPGRDEEINDLKKLIAVQNEAVNSATEHNRVTQEAIKNIKELTKNTVEAARAAHDRTKELKITARQTEQLLKLGQLTKAQAEEKLDQIEDEIEGLKELTKVHEELDKKIFDVAAATEELKEAYSRTGNIMSAVKSVTLQWMMSLDSVSKTAVLAASTITKMAIDLYNAEAAFRKTTGATREFSKDLTESYKHVRQFGVSIEMASASMAALYSNYTDFSMATDETRQSLVEQSSVLSRLGVSADVYAKSMQASTKILGQSHEEAADSMVGVAAMAQRLGVPVSQLTSQYSEMIPKLAKLGAAGYKAFGDLARISKITGLEMSKMLAITDKFDTFEGAAEQAGKLNAALGGNFVNAMSLMMETDPSKRFMMIRDAIAQTGQSFNDMSYYQRKFYTESLGLGDVGDLAALMSGDMSQLEGATKRTSEEYAKLREEAAATQSMGEAWRTFIVSLTPIITPLIGILTEFANHLTWIAEIWSDAEWAQQGLAGLVLLSLGVKGLRLAFKLLWRTAIGPIGWLIGAFELLTLAMSYFSSSTKSANKAIAVDRNSPTFLESTTMLGNNIQNISVQAQSASKETSRLKTSVKSAAPVVNDNKAYLRSTPSTSNVTNNYHSTAGSNGEMAIYMDGDKVGSLLNKRGDEQDASARNSAYTRVTG